VEVTCRAYKESVQRFNDELGAGTVKVRRCATKVSEPD
jgi:hypothetical protein